MIEPITVEQMVTALKNRKGRVYLAANDLGCSHQTIYNYRDRYYQVREAMVEAKGKRLDIAEGKLDEAVEKGEGWAICFLLKTLGKERGYIERLQLRHGGDEQAPPITTANVTISIDADEQLKQEVLQALPIETKRKMLEKLRGLTPSLPAPTIEQQAVDTSRQLVGYTVKTYGAGGVQERTFRLSSHPNAKELADEYARECRSSYPQDAVQVDPYYS